MHATGGLLRVSFLLGLVTILAGSPPAATAAQKPVATAAQKPVATAAPKPVATAAPKPALCVLNFPRMQVLAELGPSIDGTFSLSFLHSVSLTTVLDVYRIEDDGIIQIAETFSQHGAGLPSQSNEVGATNWIHSDGLFTIELERKVSPLVIRVQSGYDNTLMQNGQEYPMENWATGALLLHPCGAVSALQEKTNGL